MPPTSDHRRRLPIAVLESPILAFRLVNIATQSRITLNTRLPVRVWAASTVLE